jgi:hypothetical protein
MGSALVIFRYDKSTLYLLSGCGGYHYAFGFTGTAAGEYNFQQALMSKLAEIIFIFKFKRMVLISLKL